MKLFNLFTLCPIVVALALVSVNAGAAPAMGDKTFSISGGIQSDDGTQYNVNTSYGRFFNDTVLVKADASFFDLGGARIIGAGGSIQKLFPRDNSAVVPYIELRAQYVSFDGDFGSSNYYEATPAVGLKFYASEKAAVFAQVENTWTFGGDDAGRSDSRAQILFGVEVYF